MEGDVITHFEADHLVQSLQEIDIKQYASSAWDRQHEAIYKLNLQSHRNARAREDEFVLDLIVTWDKVKVLIHDLITSQVWKQNVLPLVQEAVCSLNSARSYMLVYHEAMVSNFLEVLLYHRTACEEAGDLLVDLIGWTYSKLVSLNSFEHEETLTSELSRSEELQYQLKELEFGMGISCLSIVRFITDHLEGLTLAVVQQLIEQCDIFCVLVPLMETKPWVKDTKNGKLIYENQQWLKLRDSAKVPKVEAQIWLTVYNLFMNQDVRSKYELTSYRKNNLLRLRKFLNETVIDQIPVLGNLLRALEEMSIMNEGSTSKISAFLIQQMPELANNICVNRNWQEIAEHQRKNYLVETEESRKRMMDLLMTGLDDMLEDPTCANCGVPATNRCSKCHSEWYCSRKCQVEAWKKHKQICAVLAEQVTKKQPSEATQSKPKIEDITDSK